MNNRPTKKAYEHIIVIVTFIIIGSVLLSRLGGIIDAIEDKLTKLTVSNVQMGIHLHFLYSVMDGVPTFRAYPDSLDSAPPQSQCGLENPFFVEVLNAPGLTDDSWFKGESVHHYIAPNGSTYVYMPSKGEFHQ